MRHLVIVFALLTLCAPAFASYPHPGDRAPDVAGPQMTGGARIELGDYRGRWVLVEFSQPG